jgi:hypothetical protein
MQNYLKKSKLIIFSRFALKICITRIKVKYHITKIHKITIVKRKVLRKTE